MSLGFFLKSDTSFESLFLLLNGEDLFSVVLELKKKKSSGILKP